MKKFANGGVVSDKSKVFDDSIITKLSPGAVFIKRSSWEADKGESLLPFLNIDDTITIVDDDEWAEKFPHL